MKAQTKNEASNPTRLLHMHVKRSILNQCDMCSLSHELVKQVSPQSQPLSILPMSPCTPQKGTDQTAYMHQLNCSLVKYKAKIY